MAANSRLRKIAKGLLKPLSSDRTYKYIQAASKAWDIKSGSWSEPELDLLGFGLRAGETTLDIGGNYGLYSYHMGKVVGKHGKVFSFEPIRFTYESHLIVSRLLGYSDRLVLYNKGCSNENTCVKFSVPVQKSGALASGLTYIGGRNDDRDGKDIQVRWDRVTDIDAEVIRLDDFLPKTADLPLVKIDIEGAEFFCLEGAKNLFTEHRPSTICEINPWYLEGFGVRTHDVTNFFLERGYKIFFYTNDGGQKKLTQVPIETIVEDNYIFLHPSRFDRFETLLPPKID